MSSTTSPIRNIVSGRIPRGYERQAEAVITALENAMYSAADSLLASARSRGVGERDARAAITNAGLAFRPAPAPVAATPRGTGPAVTDAGSGQGGKKQRLAALEAEVRRLSDLARRHLGR